MRKHALKLTVIAALALAMPLSLAACGGSSTGSGSTSKTGAAAQVASPGASCASPDSSNPLKIGMEAAYAPFNWTQKDDSNGAVKIDGGDWANGYDVQIARRIGQYLCRDVVVVKTSWDGLIPAVTSGTIDLIVAGMSPTAERRQAIDFSDPYYSSDAVVVVKKGSKWASATSINDFQGAKITAQLGTMHYDLIDQMKGVSKQAAMADFPTMIAGLESGAIDGYISERPGALSAVAANSNLTFVSFTGSNGFKVDQNNISISVGMKKGSPLLTSVNAALKGISSQERSTLMDNAIKQQPVGD
ncbi:MAG: transporter substrate-binding domain-containing protein [Bifidobacteriaceae bacterium]|jgi:putative lysine transport system substrate-binding protein|nr:transporter substrate-binding domain-containing protein [Bifidobacteriaceae bacterium]